MIPEANISERPPVDGKKELTQSELPFSGHELFFHSCSGEKWDSLVSSLSSGNPLFGLYGRGTLWRGVPLGGKYIAYLVPQYDQQDNLSVPMISKYESWSTETGDFVALSKRVPPHWEQESRAWLSSMKMQKPLYQEQIELSDVCYLDPAYMLGCLEVNAWESVWLDDMYVSIPSSLVIHTDVAFRQGIDISTMLKAMTSYQINKVPMLIERRNAHEKILKSYRKSD